LEGIVAEGGGDWEEAVKDGLETAMRQLKWRSDAKKVIILVGSSPPHEQDVPTIRRLVTEWHSRGGVVSTIDGSQVRHEGHERLTYRWLYGEDPKVISPLPEFYGALRDSFREIAHEGGGEMLSLGQDPVLVRHVLVLTFGPQWEKDIARIARGFWAAKGVRNGNRQSRSDPPDPSGRHLDLPPDRLLGDHAGCRPRAPVEPARRGLVHRLAHRRAGIAARPWRYQGRRGRRPATPPLPRPARLRRRARGGGRRVAAGARARRR